MRPAPRTSNAGPIPHRLAPSQAPLLLVFGLGLGEVLLIVGLLVLLFGARKLPDLARGLGSGIRNFKGELKEPEDDRSQGDGDGRSG